MRALVMGGAGMLGHRLCHVLHGRAETFVTLRRPYGEYRALDWFDERRVIDRVDAANDEDLERALRVARPNVVFNAVGLVKQRREVDPLAAISVNALLPHRLAARCASVGARLIHISTDCVFSGARGHYTEEDVPDARDLYGRSKLLGEVDGEHCLTIRTSMIGREIRSGRGLLEWFLAHRGGRVPGYTRARFSGLSTLELSRVLADVAERHTQLRGVWHVAGDPISKFDLLGIVNERFGAAAAIEPDEAVACDRTLDASRFMNATGYRPPSWAEMVTELAADPTPYDTWANPWISIERDRSTASTS